MVEVTLLGTGGMLPLHYRFLTSMLCRINGKMLLIDCGEGTQVTMKLAGWGFKNLDVICITHFHADHISGLVGLLLTLGNSGRTEPVNMVGPVGLESVVKSLCIIAPELPFEILYHEVGRENLKELKLSEFLISTCTLEHNMPCIGYKIELRRAGKFDASKAKNLEIPVNYWSHLQKGEVVEVTGKTFTPAMVMGESRKGIKISYATDTRPVKELLTLIEGSDLYIGEGLYGDDDKKDKAIKHGHMVFSEAATLARDGNVKEMWLTHFSPALTNPTEFLDSAKNIFENTVVGKDRLSKTLFFDE